MVEDPMHKASLANRIEFYKWVSAKTCFEQARHLLTELRDCDPDTTPDWKIMGMWAAFFVTYAKPFKQKPVGKGVKYSLRLDENTFVPSEHFARHESLIRARDKMYAHTDYMEFTSDEGYYLNGVVAAVNERGELRFGIRGIAPSPAVIDVFLHMVQILDDKAKNELNKWWILWAPSCPLPSNSVWDVNVGKDVSEVLVPVKSIRNSGSGSQWPRPV